MVKITIYIIEDSLSFQRNLNSGLREKVRESLGYIQFNIVSILNVIDFYNNIQDHDFSSVDIFIIDIDLNTYFDGIMLGKKIRTKSNSCKIIYLTGFENKAIDIINEKIHPEGYVVKSTNLDTMLFQVVQQLKKIIIDYTNTDKQLLITSGSQKNLVAYKEILYIAVVPGIRNGLLLQSNVQEILFTDTLSNIKKDLTSPPFILNLKSFIINFEAIKTINRTEGIVIFRNDFDLYIGKQAVKKIEDFQKGKA
ncbi:LytR/AlgR family response regulator transcription factor [Enterococcus sp. AZ126]|uniref:LytR/AlgR family response regulator transcription factor n=1 Tax=Enterococcus sp. AZ126 TaxID=2774635 RepID=UPI003F26E478